MSFVHLKAKFYRGAPFPVARDFTADISFSLEAETGIQPRRRTASQLILKGDAKGLGIELIIPRLFGLLRVEGSRCGGRQTDL